MENILRNYDYEVKSMGNSEHLLLYKEKYFRIGSTIYNILKKAKVSKTIEDLAYEIDIKEFTTSKLIEIINNNIIPIFNKEYGNTQNQFIKNYWWTGELLASKYTTYLARPFKFFFRELFPYVFIVLLVLNAFIFFGNTNTIFSNTQNCEILQIIIVYFLLFIILLIHELGHIAASASENLSPKSIGFGFYFFMPMMFVNLTDAWVLSKSARVKINLAGITMQMVINMVLYICLLFVPNIFIIGIINKLMLVNTIIILLNLIPFFKFDGYWILSDLSRIPNLLIESNKRVMSYFVKRSPFKPINELSISQTQNIFLTIYTALRLVFLVMMITVMFMFIIYNIIKSSYFIMSLSDMELSVNSVIDILKHIVLFVFVFIICKKYILAIYQLIRKKQKNKSNGYQFVK